MDTIDDDLTSHDERNKKLQGGLYFSPRCVEEKEGNE